MSGMDHDKSGHDGPMTWEKFDEMASEYFHPMDGNLAYLSVALGACMELVLYGFVWHPSDSDTNSQLASGSANTDYYSLMHKIEVYGGLGVWGTAFITQLLATFGIMVGINMMVWGMVLPLVGGLLELTIAVLGFLAYNQFFDQATMATPNAYASAYGGVMEREMAKHTASHVAGAFELYLEMGNWLWAAYMNSSEEEKAGWREDKDFLMMLQLTPEIVEDWGMDGDKKMMDKEMMDKEMMDKEMKDDKKPEGGPPKLIRLLRF
jgi:hypothetical protein